MQKEIRKPWVWAASVIVLVISLTACGGTESQSSAQSQSESSSSQAESSAAIPKEESQKPKVAAPMSDFVKAFNSKSSTPITNPTEFDPQNQGSRYYRTEYRLGAYLSAKGTHANVGSLNIDIVEYGGRGQKDNTCLRVYLSGDNEGVLASYPSLAKSADSALSDKDIQSALNSYTSSFGGEVTDVLSFAPSKQVVQSDYLMKKGSGTEAFIDIDSSKTK